MATVDEFDGALAAVRKGPLPAAALARLAALRGGVLGGEPVALHRLASAPEAAGVGKPRHACPWHGGAPTCHFRRACRDRSPVGAR